MAVSFGEALRGQWSLGSGTGFGGLLVGQLLGVLLPLYLRIRPLLPERALPGDQLLQPGQALPLEARLHARHPHPLHDSDRLEHVHDVVQPADLGLDQHRVLGVHQHPRHAFQDDGLLGGEEDAQEAGSQVLERLLPLVGDRLRLAELGGLDGLDRLPQPAPDVLVLLDLPDHLQALEDVDDVVDPAPLDLELPRGLVQLDHDAVPALEARDELAAELREALGLAVVAEDLPPEVLLPLGL